MAAPGASPEARGQGRARELGGLDSAGRSDSRELLLQPKTATGGRGERRREDGGSGGDGREGRARSGELLSLAMRCRVCEAAGVGTRRRGSRGEGFERGDCACVRVTACGGERRERAGDSVGARVRMSKWALGQLVVGWLSLGGLAGPLVAASEQKGQPFAISH